MESLPLKPRGGATPPGAKSQKPSRKKCNRKTYKAEFTLPLLGLFGENASDQKIQTLPPRSRSLPSRGLTVPMYERIRTKIAKKTNIIDGIII